MPTVEMPDPNRSYSLADLQHWPQTGTHLAVLGFPVQHSISPAMHNAALRVMRERNDAFADWCYYKFEVDPEALAPALQQLHAAGFKGLNLTVPHKVDAVELLQDIDPEALRMGAVNTLLRSKDGWKGYNTDGYGIEKALHESLGVDLAGSAVVLIGAGGAARATAVQCLASGCDSLWIVNRTAQRAQDLRTSLLSLYPDHAQRIAVFTPDQLDELPPRAVWIQGTSLGLQPTDPLPLSPDLLDAGHVVFDMIYNPAQTPLLQAAKAKGLAVANGLEMLIWQGARALEIWTGEPVPVAAMRAAALAALRSDQSS